MAYSLVDMKGTNTTKRHLIFDKVISGVRKVHLSTRVVVFYFLCCLLPCVIITVSVVFVVQNNYKNHLLSGYNQSFHIFSAVSDNLIDKFNSNISVVSTYAKTQHRILHSDEYAVGNNNQIIQEYKKYLNNALLTEQEIISIEVTSLDKVLESSPYRVFAENFTNNEYYLQMNSSDDLHYWQLLDKNSASIITGNMSITLKNYGAENFYYLLSTPVKNTITGQKIGYINYILSAKLFTNLLKSLDEYDVYDKEPRKAIDFSIVDGENRILFSSAFETGSSLDEKIVAQKKEGETVITDDMIIMCDVSQKSNLQFICTATTDSLNSFSSTIVWIILLFLPVAILLTIVAIIFIKSITKPLNELVEHMRIVESGNGTIPVLYDGSTDEISEVINKYNEMLKRIGRLQNELLIKERHRQKAEYDAITSLINPHFLYNTLDIINWKAYAEGKSDVADAIQNLSAFFRLSQKSSKRPYTLQDEIELTKCYCLIQKDKIGNKIEFIYDLAPDTLNCDVINIILQPLVENAIFHGILSSDKEKGKIVISSFFVDKFLVLQVKNSGKELPLNFSTKSFKSSHIISNYGLFSIDERVKFAFGETSKLNLYTNKEGWTIAEIYIPQKGGDGK